MIMNVGGGGSASSIGYDNANSGLSATNVQGAVDEVSANLTASDDTKFRFGVNDEGKYGYIVPDSVGADTFHPFSEGFCLECGYAIGLTNHVGLICIYNENGIDEQWATHAKGNYLDFAMNLTTGALACGAIKDCTVLVRATNGTTPVAVTQMEVKAGDNIAYIGNSTTNALHISVMVIDG